MNYMERKVMNYMERKKVIIAGLTAVNVGMCAAISVRGLSPADVFEGRTRRLVTDDKTVKVPSESTGLVNVQVRGGTFAAVIETRRRRKSLIALCVRRGADTRRVKRVIEAELL